MKKLVCLISILTILFMCCACGGGDSGNAGNNNDNDGYNTRVGYGISIGISDTVESINPEGSYTYVFPQDKIVNSGQKVNLEVGQDYYMTIMSICNIYFNGSKRSHISGLVRYVDLEIICENQNIEILPCESYLAGYYILRCDVACDDIEITVNVLNNSPSWNEQTEEEKEARVGTYFVGTTEKIICAFV